MANWRFIPPTRRRAGLALLIAGTAAAAALGFGIRMPASAQLGQYLLGRAWHAAPLDRAAARPWPWAETAPFARLSIPRLGASWIVVAASTQEPDRTGAAAYPAFAPVYLSDSALPGAPGVSRIAAHCGTHFGLLDRIEPGTGILLERTDGGKTVFIVDEIGPADSSRQAASEARAPRLELSTCSPFADAPPGAGQRYIVSAEAVL